MASTATTSARRPSSSHATARTSASGRSSIDTLPRPSAAVDRTRGEIKAAAAEKLCAALEATKRVKQGKNWVDVPDWEVRLHAATLLRDDFGDDVMKGIRFIKDALAQRGGLIDDSPTGCKGGRFLDASPEVIRFRAAHGDDWRYKARLRFPEGDVHDITIGPGWSIGPTAAIREYAAARLETWAAVQLAVIQLAFWWAAPP